MGAERTPAKVSDIDLVFTSRRSVAEASGVERWTIQAVVPGAGARPEDSSVADEHVVDESVGRLDVLVIDLVRCPDPWGELDASNEDIAQIGETVFDMNTGQLAERFEARLQRVGDRVLVVDYVELEPHWQRHNVAALLVAECLDQLRAACRVAVCLPGPLDRPDLTGEDYDEAVRRMQGVWSQVGFRPYEQGVWFLDPNRPALEESLARLRAQHGLS